jgi:hypothetical protein
MIEREPRMGGRGRKEGREKGRKSLTDLCPICHLEFGLDEFLCHPSNGFSLMVERGR